MQVIYSYHIRDIMQVIYSGLDTLSSFKGFKTLYSIEYNI